MKVAIRPSTRSNDSFCTQIQYPNPGIRATAKLAKELNGVYHS
jgi:hypothetical protein